LFAAAVATLDRLGLGILEARALATRDGRVLDSFQALPAQTERAQTERVPSPEHVAQALRKAIRHPDAVRPTRRALPRRLRHFNIAPRVEFSEAGALTRMTLVAGDRPGLLADVAQVLRAQRLRVHDARIATFGERVEDFFLISDNRDAALGIEQQDSLRSALIAAVELENA
jgi:[protein-PII] uridylyltransferase